MKPADYSYLVLALAVTFGALCVFFHWRTILLVTVRRDKAVYEQYIPIQK